MSIGMKSIVVIGVLLMLCFSVFFAADRLDCITFNFATLEDAENTAIFKQGWLPPILPNGATRIKGKYDVDTNRSKGSFYFSTESPPSYLEEIKSKFNGEVSENTEFTQIFMVSKDSRWTVILEKQRGYGQYSMAPAHALVTGISAAESRKSK